MNRQFGVPVLVVIGLLVSGASATDDLAPLLKTQLERAGKNRAQLEQALAKVPAKQRQGMQFLIAHMPVRDLQSLSSDYLLDNCRWAYQIWQQVPWKDQVPQAIFLNDVLPYASINERRDRWRMDFHDRFQPLIKDAKTPAAAAAILNQKMFPLLKVRYSTKRPKADQSPYESIKAGTASCTGLSVLLIDACRSVGVPARFVGTPLWTNKSGNHSWVEVWDNGWHFTGAAEPTGNQLDRAWFVGRAATAQRDHRLHAIYAVSFRRTPQPFPFVWDRRIDYVRAVNVTDRYTRLGEKLPDGVVRASFRAVNKDNGERQAVRIQVLDQNGKQVFQGTTNDERFDANHHLSVPLRTGEAYEVVVHWKAGQRKRKITIAKAEQLFTFELGPATAPAKKQPSHPTSAKSSPTASLIDAKRSDRALAELRQYLTQPSPRPALLQEAFAKVPLTRKHADQAQHLLLADHRQRIRHARAAEMKARTLKSGDLVMPFFYKVFGKKPQDGRSLYISMHGGGGTTKQTNNRQWENQKGLYKPAEGVYLAPRAPTDTWNLWHQGHIDRLFDRLIENLIVFEDVNPNRVYLMGYSAGGDGVYQLAPRMADRFAAAAMMAGHPNETSPLGLRNLPFAIYMGGRDSAYNRNGVARKWEQSLKDLHTADPKGYPHLVKIYPDKGHWMDRLDASAVPWMASFRRQPFPTRVIWQQDDVRHDRFYWLAATASDQSPRAHVLAERKGQHISVTSSSTRRITIRLNDEMLDLDQPVTIKSAKTVLFANRMARTIHVISQTISERGDPQSVFSAQISVSLP